MHGAHKPVLMAIVQSAVVMHCAACGIVSAVPIQFFDAIVFKPVCAINQDHDDRKDTGAIAHAHCAGQVLLGMGGGFVNAATP